MSKRVVPRRRSRQEWTLIVQRFRTSGLDARTFCARERIGYASFRAWRAKLNEPPAAPKAASTLPLSSVPFIDLGAMSPSMSTPLHVELELGGDVVLRLKRG